MAICGRPPELFLFNSTCLTTLTNFEMMYFKKHYPKTKTENKKKKTEQKGWHDCCKAVFVFGRKKFLVIPTTKLSYVGPGPISVWPEADDSEGQNDHLH